MSKPITQILPGLEIRAEELRFSPSMVQAGQTPPTPTGMQVIQDDAGGLSLQATHFSIVVHLKNISAKDGTVDGNYVDGQIRTPNVRQHTLGPQQSVDWYIVMSDFGGVLTIGWDGETVDIIVIPPAKTP